MPDKFNDILSDLTCSDDTELGRLFNRARPEEKRALIEALQEAYKCGQVDSDRKTGRFVSMVVGPLLGIEPTLDGVAIGMGVKSIATIKSTLGRLVDRRSQ